jgi:N-acetylmuramoyl-L-alanine amidase
MAVIAYTTKDIDLLGRLMRAEAVGEGDLGMLMVGNVVVNRVLVSCYTFHPITNIYQAVFQTPGGFSGSKSSLFFGSATTKERELAERVLKGEYYYPATHALWFRAPGINVPCDPTWFGQSLAGRYKSHCFYRPAPGVCPELY